MQPTLVSLLADPNDGGDLQLHTFASHLGSVREGVLLNPLTGRWYPVQNGIPTLFADALRPDDVSFVRQWSDQLTALGCAFETQVAERHVDFARIESERLARDQQAEYYDNLISLKMLGWFEVPAYRRAMDLAGAPEAALPILEAGGGTGRFTGLFAQEGPPVVSIDMSRDSIERNRVRHLGNTRAPVHYVHADLTHLPLKSGAFGRVLHVGVYEHIPSRGLREQFLSHARRVLVPQGRLLLSAYRYGGLTKRFEKEGEHAGGIPFFRFTEDELRDEVGPYFDVQNWKGNLGIYMSMLTAQPRA